MKDFEASGDDCVDCASMCRYLGFEKDFLLVYVHDATWWGEAMGPSNIDPEPQIARKPSGVML